MKPVIYQIVVRYFGNTNTTNQQDGTIETNGCGRFADITETADDPDVVKGRAGSLFAVRDYFDVCPDYARHPSNRLDEFASLVDRALPRARGSSSPPLQGCANF